MPNSTSLPIVAIVGRPNVGKSRLFNRYAGRRRALVEDVPGVTRDRIAEEVEVDARRVLIVDTAGLDPDAKGSTTRAVQAQARSAVREADAILLVVDAQAGLLPEDQAIARTLRRSEKPLVVAVNKIDTPAHAGRLTEFHELGFEGLYPVSAEHGSGAFDPLEALVAAIPPAIEAVEASAEGVRVAVVGRPNVGKSSLVNRLLGEERVVVSAEPGTTRDAVDTRLTFAGEPFVLVDTAGLRRPGRRTRLAERGSALMTVRSLERAQVALLVIDAAEGFTDQDASVASLVRDRGCAAVLLANQWDRLTPEAGQRALEGIEHGIRFMSDTPVLSISAKTGTRVGRVLPLVQKLASVGQQRIDTAGLNRWLAESVARHAPSMARRGRTRRPIKFFYATQTGVRPPTFVLFCTDPRAVRPAYLRFLERRLRESFDLSGTPVRLQLRARDQRP